MKMFRKLNHILVKPHLSLQMARSSTVSTPEKLSFRPATLKEMDLVTREAIKEGWHVGPYDFPNAYAFDPQGFIMGEKDNKPVGHVSVLRYPNHSTYVGGRIVLDTAYRGDGFGKALYYASYEVSDKRYTIGGDVVKKAQPWFEAIGYEYYWDIYLVELNQGKVIKNLNGINLLSGQVMIKPLNYVSLSKVLQYDSFIFGTQRHVFIKNWIATPGSFGYAAVMRDGNIAGYTILRQVIRGGGTEIGLAMAPFYADNVHIAKALIKTAAEECSANKAVPNTKLDLFHPVGEGCGDGSSELMEELGAELSQIGVRLYNKGVPPGRKIDKIYGITSPSFD